MTVIENFIARQGEALVGGVVIRAFKQLEYIDCDQHSQMPIPNERRLFFFNGELLANLEYWSSYEYRDESLPTYQFEQIAKQIPSPFFTMDVAKLRDGLWEIIEIGDGGVSGMPDDRHGSHFYERLSKLI